MFLRHPDPLSSSKLKLVRASEHLSAFQQDVLAYLKDNPGAASPQIDPDTKQVVVRFRQDREPPPRLSLIAGDCLVNLRASLDHAAYALALHVKSRHLRKIFFPICDTPSAFNETCATRRALNRLPKQMLAVLETLQPYHRDAVAGPRHLFALRELSNADKHHELALTVLYSGFSVVDIVINDRLVTRSILSGTSADGAPLASSGGVIVGLNDDVKVKAKIETAVAFKERRVGSWNAIELLEGMLQLIQLAMIPTIEPLFDKRFT